MSFLPVLDFPQKELPILGCLDGAHAGDMQELRNSPEPSVRHVPKGGAGEDYVTEYTISYRQLSVDNRFRASLIKLQIMTIMIMPMGNAEMILTD